MAKAIFEVDVVINDASVSAAINNAQTQLAALELARTKGTVGSTARQRLVQAGAAVDVTRQAAEAAGVSPAVLADLDAVASQLRDEYKQLAGSVQKSDTVEKEYNAAKKEAAKALREEARNRQNADLPIEGEELSPRDRVLANERKKSFVADVVARDPEVTAERFDQDRSNAELQRLRAEERLNDTESLQNITAKKVATIQQEIATLEASMAGENRLIQANADLIVAKEQHAAAVAANVAEQRAALGLDREQPVLDVVREREAKRAEEAAIRANDPVTRVSESAGAASVAKRRANIAEDLLKDENAIRDQHRQEAAAGKRKLALLQRTLANENGLLQVQAQTLVAAKQVQAAERKLAAETLKAAIQTGELGRGSFIQRIQANVANRQGGALRAPTEFASGRQLGLGSLITTGRFALSGGLLYGGIQGISTAIKEAQELEKILNQIRRQFESLGKADEFDGFAEGMLRIARETGAAADEVAFVGFQLQGAFGGDTARAIRETEAAFQAVRVTGLSINEVIDAFTALTQNFDSAGVSIANVSDTALGLQERFGVLAKETISFAADLAPVAAQAGFTVQQLEALGAVGQKYSGRSGSSLAEAFGRILPSIQGNAVEFLNLFDQLGDENLSKQVAEAFSSGNIAEFFQILLRSYSDLSGAQKNYVIELLGGRREAQALIPILENSGELLNEFANAQNDAGKTSQYFGDLQQTLSQQLAEFGQELTQLGIKLLNSGITDFFEDLIRLAGGAIDILVTLLDVLGGIGGALGSIPGVGGGLGALLEGLLLYKGVGLLAGGIKGKLGGAAVSAVAGGGLVSSGTAPLAAAASQTASASIAARYAAGAAGKSGATAFAGGLKTAFAGVSWVGLGVTIGALVVTEIQAGVSKAAKQTISDIEGSDNKAGFNDEELGRLGKEFDGPVSNFDDLVGQYQQAYEDMKGIGEEDREDIASIAELREAMVRQAKTDASAYQQILDIGGFSKDSKENSEAANASLDEHKTRMTDFFTALAEDEEVLAEIARNRLVGTEREGNKEAIGEATSAMRDDLNSLISEIASEDADPRTISALMEIFNKEIPAARRAISRRVAQEQEQVTQDAIAVLSADEAISGYDAGEVGLAQARAALREAITGRQRLGFGEGTADQRKELADLIKREKEFQSEILLREAEALTEGVEGFNTSTPQSRLATVVNLLNSGRLTPADQRKATDLALDALKDVHQARLDAADTAAEEAKILAEGTPVPEALKTELVYQYLANASVLFQDFVSTVGMGIGDVATAITRTAAEIYANGGVTIQEATRQAIEAQIATLKLMRAKIIEGLARASAAAGVAIDTSGLQGAIDSMDRQIASLEQGLDNLPEVTVPDYGNFGVDAEGAEAKRKAAAEEAKRDAEEAARKAHDIRLAQLDVYKAYVEGDPVAEADLDARIAQENAAFARATGDRAGQLQAQAALIRANRARQEALSDIGIARNDLNLARRGDDPVAAAYIELANANEALRLARGTAAKYRAQAQQQRAGRALAEAIQDIGLAQLELAQAMAAAAGDSVEAARKALQIAKQQLANIKKNSPKDQAAILRAQADVVGAEAALRDADLSERQRAIDVALQLEQITVGQAIAQLQALLTIPKLTKEQTDAILLKIKSLKDELGQDFRFNLPTDLYLPTAYEVRRAAQTPGGANNYNDNRTISVQVTAETNADPDAIASAVVNAVGESGRQGTAPKRY